MPTARTDLTPDVVACFVGNGVSAMGPYRKTEISDAQLAAFTDRLSNRLSVYRLTQGRGGPKLAGSFRSLGE